MLKKTLLASSITLAFTLGAQGVQANPISNFINGLVNDVTSVQFDARRGGSSRSSSRSGGFFSRKSSSSSSSAVSKPRTPANTAKKEEPNNTTANKNNQQDAQFSNNATRPTNPQAPQAAPAASPGMMGTGSTFLSSLAGAGAGVLLANMLLSPSAAAAQGTEVATPDMLSDDQINETLAQLEKDIKDTEARLADAADDEKAKISEELSAMHNLQISLMKEKLNRIQNS